MPKPTSPYTVPSIFLKASPSNTAIPLTLLLLSSLLVPRPLEGELTSSWLYRVAAANLVELEELLSGLLELYPEVHSCSNICLDYGITPTWSRALAIWCRLGESRVHKLDLARVFPDRHLNWFVHGNGAPSSGHLLPPMSICT